MKELCNNCKYFNGCGICLRRPPVMHFIELYQNNEPIFERVYVEVDKNDWCGEWVFNNKEE